MALKLFLLNYNYKHPEAYRGYNSKSLIVAENYEEAKQKIINDDPECKYKFFDREGKPILLSECCHGHDLEDCYEIDAVNGLEIKIIDKSEMIS